MPKIVTEEQAQFSIRMPLRLKEALSELATLEHRSLAQQMNLILQQYIDKTDIPKRP